MDERGREAFAEFLTGNSDSLLRAAYLINGDRAVATDLLETSLANTHLAWSRIGAPGVAAAHARRSLVATYLHGRRRDALLRRTPGRRPADTAPADTVPADTAPATDRMWSAFGTLPARLRAAVVLRHFLGLPDESIADALGCPTAKVERQVSTALAHLGSVGEVQDLLVQRAAQLPSALDPGRVVSLSASLRRRRRAVWLAAAAVVLFGVAVLVPLLARNTSPAVPIPAKASTLLSPSLSPSPSPSTSLSTSPTSVGSPVVSAGGTPVVSSPAAVASPGPSAVPLGEAVAVYYLGDTGSRVALYREFRRTTSRNRVQAAIELMVSQPLDADYTTLWPKGTKVRSVTIKGDLATVDLTAEALQGGGGGSSAACQILQQIVWTVTAANTSIHRVALSVEGRTQGVVSQWWGVGCGPDVPLARTSPSTEVIAPIQISSHNEGDLVRSRFSFGGEATVFEAALSWSVVDSAGKALATGTSKVSKGAPGRGQWQAIVVPQGVKKGDVLELRAWEASPKDGSVTNLDTKHVTISG